MGDHGNGVNDRQGQAELRNRILRQVFLEPLTITLRVQDDDELVGCERDDLVRQCLQGTGIAGAARHLNAMAVEGVDRLGEALLGCRSRGMLVAEQEVVETAAHEGRNHADAGVHMAMRGQLVDDVLAVAFGGKQDEHTAWRIGGVGRAHGRWSFASEVHDARYGSRGG